MYAWEMVGFMSSVGLPDQNIVIVFAVVLFMSVIERTDLSVAGADAEEFGIGNRRHGGTNGGEDFTIGVCALACPKGDFIGDDTGDGRSTDTAEVRLAFTMIVTPLVSSISSVRWSAIMERSAGM